MCLISNDAFFRTRCMREALKTEQSFKRYRKIYKHHPSRNDSLTAIHNTYVLLSRMRPIIMTFRMAGKLSSECRVR